MYLSATSSSMLPRVPVVPVFFLALFILLLFGFPNSMWYFLWCGLLFQASPVVLRLMCLWVLRHPPIGGMVLWCLCRRSLFPVVSFLGLCLFRPLVLRILILIALLLVVCYLWCGFPWFFHVWFWFLLWCFRWVFLLCSSVCLWFLPYALHTWLLLTMLCRRLWWRLEMPCRFFSFVLLLCSQVPWGSVGGLLLSSLFCLLLVRPWS